jgi:hypothetical protein
MTDQVKSHYFGDDCPGGHRAEELKYELEELRRSARYNYDKARTYEARADIRLAELRVLEYEQHTGRAKKGNIASRLVVASPKELDLVTDVRASGEPGDAIWKANIANYKFYKGKAELDNSMIATLQAELIELQKE